MYKIGNCLTNFILIIQLSNKKKRILQETSQNRKYIDRGIRVQNMVSFFAFNVESVKQSGSFI